MVKHRKCLGTARARLLYYKPWRDWGRLSSLVLSCNFLVLTLSGGMSFIVHCYTISQAPEPITVSHIPCSLHHPSSPYILLISRHHYYSKFIILTPVSYDTYFFPSYFKSCSTTYLIQEQYLILVPTPPLRLHTPFPLCLSDRKILWAHRSFIHSIFASGGDMRDFSVMHAVAMW